MFMGFFFFFLGIFSFSGDSNLHFYTIFFFLLAIMFFLDREDHHSASATDDEF